MKLEDFKLSMLPRIIKNFIKITFLYDIFNYISKINKINEWEKKGRPLTREDIVKQNIVREYAKTYSIRILIETGTYLGNMINATKEIFYRIISIELDKTLYKRAKKEFSEFAHISIIHGDSYKVLPEIISNINEPCLFWLDAHYSGGITAKGILETPILNELKCILDHPVKGHVILIDDARLFGKREGYPALHKVQDLIFARDPDWIIKVQDDVIRIHKKN